jgi:ATP-binding cassette subfamily F protein 3
MSILTATNVSQSFGAFDLFNGVNVNIPNDGKIGLVGPNGIGKTTLLLILAGLMAPSSGEARLARGRRMGYLRQEAIEAFAQRDNTVYAEMLIVFAPLQEQQRRLHELEEAIAAHAGGESGALLAQYGELQEAFALAGGYDYEVRIQKTLDGLGFSAEQWHMPLSHLSGGQKTRALLARLLLERPDLLILDEPTNHLDVEAIEWLETTLRNWDGAILIVSHDRYFLDRVVNTIWEMRYFVERGCTSIDVFRGNYSAYLLQRDERWERSQEVYDAAMERLWKEYDFIKRNIDRDATNRISVGKLKRLSREIIAIEQLGIMAVQDRKWLDISAELEGNTRPMGVEEAERRLKAIRPPNYRPPRLNVHLKPAHRSGNRILRTQRMQVGYPGVPLFKADDIELWRQECAALIGPNGAGKTTFLRTLLGELEPLAGKAELGASLKIGYFAQAHDALDPQSSVLDELLKHKDMPISQARNYLAAYLFRGDDIYKPISALSGGERARLALSILALEGANLLLLDEPTNHLDIPAQEVLQQVLENFDGTVLLVSHDRYLVDQLATQIWDLRDGRLRAFKGTYKEFLVERERQASAARQAAAQQRAEARQQVKVVKRQDNAEKKRAQSTVVIEEQIQQLERALDRLGRDLQAAGQSGAFDKIQRLSAEYAAQQGKLERLLAEWERTAV